MMGRRGGAAHPRPGLPGVNLLPQEAFDAMAARSLRHRFAAGAVALALVVAGAWAFQHVRVTETGKLVAVEQAQTDRLNSQTQLLAPVRTFVTGVAAQERTVEEAMSREIYFSDVVDQIRADTPLGAQVQSLDVTLAAADPAAASGAASGAATVSPCPGPDPFNTRTVIGCVTLSGTASSRATVGELVVNLGDDNLFVEPFISTTTTGDAAEVSFSGSVGLSEKVFSKRYADPTADAATAAPTPTGGAQ